MVSFLISALNCISVLALVLCAASYFDRFNASCELLANLRAVFCLVLFLLSSLLWLSRARSKFSVAVKLLTTFAFLLNILPIASLYLRTPAISKSDTADVRVMEMNVWGGRNHDYQKVFSLIKREQPDIIGICEITPPWLQQLESNLPEYKYRVSEPHLGGICIFSRLPLTKGEIRYYSARHRPRVLAQTTIKGQPCQLIFFHPIIPLVSLEMRNGDMMAVAVESAHATMPVIAFGDMNCTPFSYFFRDFLKSANLNDSEPGFGFQPSWHAFRFPVLPIDHCFVSEKFEVVDRHLCPFMGADHLPLVTDLRLRN